MAIVANTFQTYQAIGRRENLADTIYNISPSDVPWIPSYAPKPTWEISINLLEGFSHINCIFGLPWALGISPSDSSCQTDYMYKKSLNIGTP